MTRHEPKAEVAFDTFQGTLPYPCSAGCFVRNTQAIDGPGYTNLFVADVQSSGSNYTLRFGHFDGQAFTVLKSAQDMSSETAR